MNQGKIWLVVKPTVGLPLFLGGVTVIALAVHAAVLTSTAWYPAYYSGKAAVAATMPKTAAATPAPVATAGAPADAATLVAKANTTKP
ncbi:MAG: light-harvesting protein [Pseudomonadota bacterium]